MSFLAPIAGLVAAGIGSTLVVLFWMLKLRRKPVRVSSTLLWKKSVRDLEGNIPWQRVRPSFLLFLQLLAVLLLSLAIARPVRDAGLVVSSEVIVVIDVGASMGAIGDLDGSTRLDIAMRDANGLVRQLGSRSSSTRFRVVRAGTQARLVSGRAGTWRQAIAAINSIEQSEAPSDLVSAMELVDSMQSEDISEDDTSAESASVYVFSDDQEIAWAGAELRVPISDNPETLGNLGLVVLSAQRDQADPDTCRVFVTIAGTIRVKTGVVVQARDGEAVLASRAMELVPDELGVAESTATLVFELDRAALIEVGFARNDALSIDQVGWVSLPDPSPIVTTVIALDGIADPLLVDVLGASTGGRVDVVAPGDSVSGLTGLMVYDRIERDALVQIPSIAFVQSEEQRATLDRVLSWERGHPTMRDVDLGSLRYIGADGLGGDVLATGTRGVLINESADRGVRHLQIGFALADSNWGVQISMPMFMSNTISYLLPGTSGSGRVYKTGDPIGESNTLVEQVGVTQVDGEQIGVSLLDREQSIRAGRELELGETETTRQVSANQSSGRVELWRWFVLSGLGVLMLEWVIDLSRRRVA